jgi:hypothetical protein
MKKILTIASVLFSTVVFASGTGDHPTSLSGATVVKTVEGTFKLLYKSETLTNVKVSIFDEKKKLVFSETIKNTLGFARPYSLVNLEKGNFTVAVEDHSGVTIQKISTMRTESTKLVNMLKLSNGQSKYLLTVGGKGEETITLNIYDGQRQLIHSETKAIAGDFAQVYNLSKVRGTPSFEVLHENGSLESLDY